MPCELPGDVRFFPRSSEKVVTMRFLPLVLLLFAMLSCSSGTEPAKTPTESGGNRVQQPKDVEPSQRMMLAHYMPWFSAKPLSHSWGWHWTMNAFNPDKTVDGRRQIASHFYPLIGPYDSSDPHVLEFHLLLMKLSGIDGVIVAWYGLHEFRDYPMLHKNSQHLVKQVERLGMKFAICYEDQTIPTLVKARQLSADKRIAHAIGEVKWLAENWFSLKSYVRLDGRPVLLSFGQAGLTSKEWSQCLEGAKLPIAYISPHHRHISAWGAFDWPIPAKGLSAIKQFQESSRKWPQSISVAFPRFVDIYAEAKVHKGWGRIEDEQGKTFRTSITQAISSNSQLIQIATWNDWGEGSMIEPSREYGYRDLKVLQDIRRKHIDARFPATEADLKLPAQLLALRRKQLDKSKQLDGISELIATGKLIQARSELRTFAHGP